ncbi:hypothetical protein KC973_03190 [Candidatus Saccharibacteria bacterium]|nr:hypothetical protein [Candidatus Saccharibacteria bacterium]
MNIAQFGKPQNPDPYEIPQPGADKKRTNLLMFGGLALLLLLLGVVLFSGGSAAGKQDLSDAIDSTGNALGAITEYEGDLQTNPVRNALAPVRIILLGDYNNLASIYKSTYDAKKSFGSTPKPSSADITTLEAAVKNDTIDTELLDALQPHLLSAQRSLIKVKPEIKDTVSRTKITTVQRDLQSVADIIDTASR